ncbi:MAG TPA: secondary thiamine-phosphate synthase enzyme YjbQ [Bacillota bacterium]|jgi:secondary thiamine-phosphate synthase enzyme|nr:secondary thiamine-phosphate synthase enzyme YjbQ [Peptococcaceae bacterium MAG4]NLW38662.1 YjbQ family protein [Peptococcaceae bacterium]HPZ44437.1 secondary thiamine-phosphate synthase enzyme YjbQ [Bacillota bacterium]HQD75615.1 secondary thiamine-phosphate synthase enzyme YjbQ [Bacillota bacterium]HUM59801.1 secondary thiamine-phosphate synthase enzyme YjbQ [Bacillota bacterium]
MASKIYTLEVATRERTQMVDITSEVNRIVAKSGVVEGICHLFVPHTTAGLTINENADPTVTADILMELNKIIPFEDGYRHSEGNSAAHIKSSLTGVSLSVFVTGGRLLLGTWQGVYFCEYDGPRRRKVLIKVIEG